MNCCPVCNKEGAMPKEKLCFQDSQAYMPFIWKSLENIEPDSFNHLIEL